MDDPILIMGGSSGIGRAAVRAALARGLAVRAMSRGASGLPSEPGLELLAGDATVVDDVARGLDRVRAVIYALGVRERPAMLWRKETLFSASTEILLREMPRAGVTRLVAVTGFGAGRSAAAMSTIERIGHRAILGRPYADKTRQEALIEASDLDWTIVRPVILTNGVATGRAKVLRAPETWRNGLISRADVAAYLVDAVEQGLDMRADVVLAR